MSESLLTPQDIARTLRQTVLGQEEAVQELSVALAKKLAGVNSGNVLLIGSSGTGKTSLMRAVEGFLSETPGLSDRSCLVRMHANVLAEEAERGRPGEAVVGRLLARAAEQLGPAASVEELLSRASKGIVFVDEIDKIRARVGGEPNVPGIRAQEALLTLMENEQVSVDLDGRAYGIDSRGILFVCAGAFEGLYDAVFDRVTVGEDKGSLKTVTTLDGGQVVEKLDFKLAEWLRVQDLFDYGMSPQFLSRFESIVLLRDLDEDVLVEIFLESPDSALRAAREYFAAFGIELVLSPEAARSVAQAAGRQPRLGARALKEVFRRVIRSYEFDPSAVAESTLLIDAPEVESALANVLG